MLAKVSENSLSMSPPPPGGAAPRTHVNAGKIESVDPARRLVGEFVGQAFYGVLMKQMQESSLKTGLMNGGRGEEAFQAQLGLELAARMGRSPDNAIAERIYRSFERHLKSKGWKPEDVEHPASTEDPT